MLENDCMRSSLVGVATPTPLAPSRTDMRSGSAVPDSVEIRACRWLTVLMRMFSVLLGAACVLGAVAAARNVIAFGDGTYTDTVLLTAMLRVRDGLPLYPDVTKPPFMFLHYGPLYPLVGGIVARVADLGLVETLAMARTLSVVMTLVAAGSVAGLARVCGATTPGALVAAGLFLSSYVIHPWAYSARTDLPAAGFALAGMLVLLRWPSRAGAAGAGLLMAAGFECKQTYAIGVAVAGLSLVWQRHWSRMAILIGAWLGVVTATALVMSSLTDGRFLEQTIGNNVIPFRPATVPKHLAFYLPQSFTVLILAGVGLCAGRRVGPASVTMRLYALATTVVGIVSIARMGSNYNYLLEATAVLTVFGGVGFTRLLRVIESVQADNRGPGRIRTAGAALLAAAMTSAMSLPVFTLWVSAEYPPDQSALIAAIRERPGPVLTERDSLAVMLAGKEPIAGDPIGISSISLDGRWDPAPLHALIRSQAFSMVVLNAPLEETPNYDGFPWWPPDTLEQLRQRYRFEGRLGRYYLYVPDRSAAQR